MISIWSRFSSISRDVNKFYGCFKQIEALEQSGKTHEDKIKYSLEIHQATLAHSGFKFLMESLKTQRNGEPICQKQTVLQIDRYQIQANSRGLRFTSVFMKV